VQIKNTLTNLIGSRSKNRLVFLFAVALFAIGVPFSRFLMSMAGAILVINWFLEGNLEQKIKSILQSKTVLICLLVYFVHLLWFIPTQNINYGLSDLWIKIPLFFMPIIFYTSEPLSRKEYQMLLQLYIWGVCISSFTGFIAYILGNLADKREMALFISYLRFEINICFACFVCLFLLFKIEMKNIFKILIITVLCWFSFFLIYSGSITAVMLLFVVGCIIVIKTAINNKNRLLRYVIPLVFAGGVSCTGFFIYYSVKQYFTVDFSIETENIPIIGLHFPFFRSLM